MAVVFGVLVVMTGCSFSGSFNVGGTPSSTAEEVIEGDLATEIGLTDVEAECGTPANEDVGATFECVSTSNLGEILYRATIQEDEFVNVLAINVLSAEQLGRVEELSTPVIADEAGRPFAASDLACGPAPVLIPESLVVVCRLTDPADGATYDAEVLFRDDYDTLDSVSVPDLPVGAPSAGGADDGAADDSATADPGGASGDPAVLKEQAVDAIEGQLAQQIGVVPLVADCDDPADGNVGTVFACTADSEIGVIDWQVTIQDGGIVNVQSTNLIVADALPRIETAALEVLEAQEGVTMDCGDRPLVLPSDNKIGCTIDDPISGRVFAAELEMLDLQNLRFNVTIPELAEG
ncbi:MAG: hypothetical protein AAGD35_13325 [Actinomycetota bacterium]